MFSNSVDQLRVSLTVYQAGATKFGLQVSWAKTKLMHVGDGPDPPPDQCSLCVNKTPHLQCVDPVRLLFGVKAHEDPRKEGRRF